MQAELVHRYKHTHYLKKGINYELIFITSFLFSANILVQKRISFWDRLSQFKMGLGKNKSVASSAAHEAVNFKAGENLALE